MAMRVTVGLVAAVGLSACQVGTGSGAASGNMFFNACGDNGTDFGTPDAKAPYELKPSFFAGEPIEDITSGRKSQRLVIRMQRTGGGFESTDTLTFDIADSYEVARCLRGRLLPDGTPDYDVASCYWPDNGGPVRMKVGDLETIRAYLTPFDTCGALSRGKQRLAYTAIAISPQVVGAPAVPPGGEWPSWIELASFGNASVDPKVPRTERSPVASTPGDFKVDYNERLFAPQFHLLLEDDRVIQAARDRIPAQPAQLGGVLDGFFDFDLERSRAAQTFP